MIQIYILLYCYILKAIFFRITLNKQHIGHCSSKTVPQEVCQHIQICGVQQGMDAHDSNKGLRRADDISCCYVG